MECVMIGRRRLQLLWDDDSRNYLPESLIGDSDHDRFQNSRMGFQTPFDLLRPTVYLVLLFLFETGVSIYRLTK